MTPVVKDKIHAAEDLNATDFFRDVYQLNQQSGKGLRSECSRAMPKNNAIYFTMPMRLSTFQQYYLQALLDLHRDKKHLCSR